MNRGLLPDYWGRMELIIAIACGFCAGCLSVSWSLYRRARKDYKLTIQHVRRALESMERGHLLRVIQEEPLLKEDDLHT